MGREPARRSLGAAFGWLERLQEGSFEGPDGSREHGFDPEPRVVRHLDPERRRNLAVCRLTGTTGRRQAGGRAGAMNQRAGGRHAAFSERAPRGPEAGYEAWRRRISALMAGTTACRSPITAYAARDMIGASGSVLITRIALAALQPTMCWIAPLIPQAI